MLSYAFVNGVWKVDAESLSSFDMALVCHVALSKPMSSSS